MGDRWERHSVFRRQPSIPYRTVALVFQRLKVFLFAQSRSRLGRKAAWTETECHSQAAANPVRLAIPEAIRAGQT